MANKNSINVSVCCFEESIKGIKNELSYRDRIFLRKLKSVMEENYYNQQLTLDKIAKKTCLSDRALQYKTKNLLGKTPMQYLLQYRLECAKMFIHKEGLSICETADRVGFSNYSYFSKCFREYTGMTPSKFQDKSYGMDDSMLSHI